LLTAFEREAILVNKFPRLTKFPVENCPFAVPVEMEGSCPGLLTAAGRSLTLQWKQRGHFLAFLQRTFACC